MARAANKPVVVLPVISSIQVDDYGRIYSELKTLEKRKDTLRDLLLTAYVTGVTIPTGECCVIDFLRSSRRCVDYKHTTVELARIIHGDAWPAFITELENKAPTVDIVKVVPKAIAGIISTKKTG